MSNPYPEWLRLRLIDNSLPWQAAYSASLIKFLSLYTLHDSQWLDLHIEPWTQEAVALISWDMYWSQDRVPYPPNPFLLISFSTFYHLACSQSQPVYLDAIAQATSRVISPAERRVWLELSRQIGLEEQFNLSDDREIHHTLIVDAAGGQTSIVHPTKESIKSLLESVHAQTLKYLGGLDENDLGQVIVTPWGPRYRLIEMVGHLLEHEIHHRAELSLILGLLGREGLNA